MKNKIFVSVFITLLLSLGFWVKTAYIYQQSFSDYYIVLAEKNRPVRAARILKIEQNPFKIVEGKIELVINSKKEILDSSALNWAEDITKLSIIGEHNQEIPITVLNLIHLKKYEDSLGEKQQQFLNKLYFKEWFELLDGFKQGDPFYVDGAQIISGQDYHVYTLKMPFKDISSLKEEHYPAIEIKPILRDQRPLKLTFADLRFIRRGFSQKSSRSLPAPLLESLILTPSENKDLKIYWEVYDFLGLCYSGENEANGSKIFKLNLTELENFCHKKPFLVYFASINPFPDSRGATYIEYGFQKHPSVTTKKNIIKDRVLMKRARLKNLHIRNLDEDLLWNVMTKLSYKDQDVLLDFLIDYIQVKHKRPQNIAPTLQEQDRLWGEYLKKKAFVPQNLFRIFYLLFALLALNYWSKLELRKRENKKVYAEHNLEQSKGAVCEDRVEDDHIDIFGGAKNIKNRFFKLVAIFFLLGILASFGFLLDYMCGSF